MKKQVQKSADHYTEAARDEIEMLAAIAGSADQNPAGAAACVRLLDSFEHRGPHGRHVCMVFEVSLALQELLCLVWHCCLHACHYCMGSVLSSPVQTKLSCEQVGP